MERHLNLPDYRPNEFINEVPVNLRILKNIFENRAVYVFGYGSLTYTEGWAGRNLQNPPTREDLIECVLHGYVKGPWAIFRGTNFYGLLAEPRRQVIGVLGRVYDLRDWYNLMFTEFAAGLHEDYVYRIIDITDDMAYIEGEEQLEKDYVVHTLRCSNIDRFKARKTVPYLNYYNKVWNGVVAERSPRFCRAFLRTQGFKTNKEVKEFLNAN